MIKRIRINLLNHYKSLLKLAFASFLIALIIYESRLQIQSIHPVATLHLIRSIPAQWLFLFFLLGIIASAAMVLYDAFGIKAFQYEISRKDLFAISFLVQLTEHPTRIRRSDWSIDQNALTKKRIARTKRNAVLSCNSCQFGNHGVICSIDHGFPCLPQHCSFASAAQVADCLLCCFYLLSGSILFYGSASENG